MVKVCLVTQRLFVLNIDHWTILHTLVASQTQKSNIKDTEEILTWFWTTGGGYLTIWACAHVWSRAKSIPTGMSADCYKENINAFKIRFKNPRHTKNTWQKICIQYHNINTYKLVKLHTTDSKTAPPVHLHLCSGQLKPRPSQSVMKRSGNMPQATLDIGRFPWKSETVVHFTRLLLEEGWHWGSITMLPLFLHQTHTSVIIPIWQHVASVSLERVLSALGKVPLTIISGTLYHYTWVCIQHCDVCMYLYPYICISGIWSKQAEKMYLLAQCCCLLPFT